MALRYGPDAPDHVRDGWERRAGREARSVPYWDAIAALNTPTEVAGFSGFTADGRRLDNEAITQRRDDFLFAAIELLPAAK